MDSPRSQPNATWTTRLDAAVARTGGDFHHVTILPETTSTQDAARDLDAQPGDIVVAMRQTNGRGRFGRAWADTGDDGVAVTFAVDGAAPGRLPIAAAVGVANALQPLLDVPVGIKWPNDVIANGRKVAGVLIEIARGVALIGVGVNVAQRAVADELAGRAASLAELGGAADRLDVLVRLVPAMADALRLDEAALAAAFASRDVLAGAEAAFRCGEETVAGRVVRVEPLAGLLVSTPGGDRWLPAATTTVLPARP